MTVRPVFVLPTDPEPERRARIQVRLNQLGEGPAALFHDLCLLLDEDLGLEARPMLVSHLLRELESSVREVLRPRRVDIAGETADAAGESEKVGAGKEHQRQIGVVLDAFGLDRGGAAGTAWYKVAKDQHGLAHRTNLAAPRELAGKVADHVERGMVFLDAVLDALDSRFLILVERLEELAATPAPTKDDAKRLVKEFPQDLVTAERFFDGLVNPAWLLPLNSVKAFSNPPAPEVDRDAGRVSFVRWPASAYLARVAADDPVNALQAARSIPATDNPFVHLDLVAVAAAVPAAKAVQLLPVLTRALAGPYLLLPDRYADLVLRLAGERQTDAAVTLLGALLAAGFGPEAKLAEEDSAHLLQTFNDDFADQLGTIWLHLLVDTLAAGLGTPQDAAQRHGQDASAFWLPLLSDTPDNVHASPQSRLAMAIRDSAERLISANSTAAAEILALLDAQPWAIFRRLRLHLITQHADTLAGEAAAALADPDLREDLAVGREWLALAAVFAAQLDQEQQQALLDAVDQGPDTARWSTDQEQRTGQPVPPESLQAVADTWQRDRLTVLGAILGPAQRRRLAELEAAYGRARPVDELPIRITPIIITPPETDPGQLAGLSASELVERAKSWVPQPTGFGGTNQFALAGRLREAVAAQGARYSTDAAAFTALEDLYLLQVLHGFQDAARREPIDWTGPLALAEEAVRRTGTAHAHELHREAANLAGRAITHPLNPVEQSDADALWSLLTAVLASPDTPIPMADPGAYLSDARAQGLRAAIDWALWRLQADADISPLFQLLDTLLDDTPLPGSDGPQVQAAVLGDLIPPLAYLNPTWTADRAPKLLSTGEYAAHAWHAYLAAPLHRPIAEQLLNLYRTHTDHREEHGDDRSARQRFALGVHLLGLYLGGVIDLEGDDSPVPAFYRGSSSGVLKQLATAVGHSARGLLDEDLPRLQAWWAWRLDATATAIEPAARAELTDTLPALAASGRLPDEWILQQFLDLLRSSGQLRPDAATFTYLTRAADTHTEQVLLLLKDWLMTLGPYDQMPRFREADIRTLLRTGLADPQQAPLAEDIINRAARRGHAQFRVLLCETEVQEDDAS